MKKIVSWWSAGVTSAVATYYAIQEYGPDMVDIYYCDTGMVHPDNERFIKECEAWYSKKINIIKSEKYSGPFDVARKTRWISGPGGARCSLELKKNPRYLIEDVYGENPYDRSIFGFEFSKKEINRAVRFVEQQGQAPNPRPMFPLIEREIDKPNALYILEKIGKIKQPAMYELGYPNNNCIMCLKANSMGYMNKMRKDFPAEYAEMAKIEREIGATIITKKIKVDGETKRQRVYLDELPEGAGRDLKPIVPECGVVCQLEFTDEIDEKTERILDGQLKMSDVW